MSDHQLCSRHIRAIQHFVDAQEARSERLKGELEEWRAHCKELEDTLLDARHDALPSELTEDDLPERLRARLMPEGYEWPRFEDGVLVRLGDTVSSGGLSFPVCAVEFGNASYCVAEFVCTVKDGSEDNYDNALCGTSFKRPAPPATRECRDGDAPDSWERLEEDARDADYYGRRDGACAKLVRRAKALADGCAGKPGEVV